MTTVKVLESDNINNRVIKYVSKEFKYTFT